MGLNAFVLGTDGGDFIVTTTGHPILIAATSETPDYEPLQTIIPSYLYQQYADDEDLAAFVEAYNELAQSYLDWFNQTPLAVYTNANINGPLLDWIAQGIYGISRPVFSQLRASFRAGINAFPLNGFVLNGSQFFQSGSATVASDDYYKRVLTWWLYAGNGGNAWGGAAPRYLNVEVLRLRVARFLYCSNGNDFQAPISSDDGFPLLTEWGQPILPDPSPDALTLAGTVHIQPQLLPAPPAPSLSASSGVLATSGGAPIVTDTGYPLLVDASGGGGIDYIVFLTYVNSIGETNGSPPGSISLATGEVFVVASPPQANGALDYNVYAYRYVAPPARFLAGLNSAPINAQPIDGTNFFAPPTPELQNAQPVPIGTAWVEPATGLVAGRALPRENTSNRLGNFIITVPPVPAAIVLQQAFAQGGILSFPFQFTAEILVEQ